MTDWSLEKLFTSLNDEIQRKLETARKSLGHSGIKGEASERVWLELLNEYLPKRYNASSAHVVDSNGDFSEQIDIVIFDRQYSPFIFHYEGQTIIPAESVYAVFESKQTANAGQIEYARKKVASVRQLHKTSLPIPYAEGTYPPKQKIRIYGGILTFESDWKPPLGQPLLSSLNKAEEEDRLELGCIASHGYFKYNKEKDSYDVKMGSKPVTAFLFELISQLQISGTVPMIDIQAYASWLSDKPKAKAH